jgi:hypothetical protein
MEKAWGRIGSSESEFERPKDEVRVRRALQIAAVLLLLSRPARPAIPEEEARAKSLEYQKKAIEAYQRKDWPAFLENAPSSRGSAARRSEARLQRGVRGGA